MSGTEGFLRRQMDTENQTSELSRARALVGAEWFWVLNKATHGGGRPGKNQSFTNCIGQPTNQNLLI